MGAHRSGKYKQVNKKHNSGKHKTKREIKKAAKGKVSVVKNTCRVKKDDKASRKLQKKNLADLKKQRVKDIFGSGEKTPFVLTFVILDDDLSHNDIHKDVQSCYSNVVFERQVRGFIHNLVLPTQKKRFSFIKLHYKSPILALETAFRVSDVVVPSFKNLNKMCDDPSVDGVLDLIRQLPEHKVLSYRFNEGSFSLDYLEKFELAFRIRLQCYAVDSKSKFSDLKIFSRIDEVLDHVMKGIHLKKFLMLQKNLKTPPIHTRPYMIIDSINSCISEHIPTSNDFSGESRNFLDVTFSGTLLGSNLLESNKYVYLSGHGMFPITSIGKEGIEHNISHDMEDETYAVSENVMDDYDIDEVSESEDTQEVSDINDDLDSSFDYIDEADNANFEAFGSSFQEDLRGYRGMDNIRDTYWDPKINTPMEYSQICKFPNFQSLQKHALKAQVVFEVGSSVTVCVKSIPLDVYAKFQTDQLTTPCLFFLYPFEEKYSLNHYAVKILSTYENELNDDDELLFNVDYSLFKSSCLFSERKIVNRKVMQMESISGDGEYFRISLYGPVIYLPAPVKVFKIDRSTDQLIMVASGYATKPNPDLVILNRHTLEGIIHKNFKKYVIVKRMFYCKDDVLYFKPVQLRTKSGIKGHILEPIGMHGSMKCKLSEVCKNQEKIMMHLYKRVFPVWDCKMNEVDEI